MRYVQIDRTTPLSFRIKHKAMTPIGLLLDRYGSERAQEWWKRLL